MSDSWPCLSCPARDYGLCGAMLGKRDSRQHLFERPDWQDFRTTPAGQTIVVRGEPSEHVYILCDGWAYRYYQLFNSRRQILHILLSGDLFSALTVFFDRSHFSVRALTDVRISRFRRSDVQARLSQDASISTTIAKSRIAQSVDVDELLTVVGQFKAEERLAYLFLHLLNRMSERSVIRELRFRVPLRQHQIAEFTGLTPVHVNRVLSKFRAEQIADLSDGYLSIFNLPKLKRLGSLTH